MTLRRRIGQGLMLVAALGALAASAGGIAAMDAAGPDRFWIESWRSYGFMVFAGLFVLLAWRPTRSPLVWELVFFHKAAMAGSWLLAGSADEARSAGPVDLGLCLLILAAWLSTRGWRSWGQEDKVPDGPRQGKPRDP